MCRTCIMIRAYLMNILKWLDAGANVLVGGIFTIFVNHCVPALGNFHYTCSEAWAEMQEKADKGEPIWMYEEGCIACRMLTWMQNKIFKISGDHCVESMDGMPTNVDSA